MFILAVAIWGARRSLVVVLMVSLALFPTVVHRRGYLDASHVGLSDSTFALYSFTFPIAASLIVFRGSLASLLHYKSPQVLLLGLAFGLLFGGWAGNLLGVSGFSYLVLMVCALACGMGAQQLGLWKCILSTAATLCFVQMSIATAQYFGADIFLADGRTALLVGDRVSGTLGHPNNLGKVLVALVFLICMVLITKRESISSRMRTYAVGSLFAAFGAVLLSQGRANIVALVLVLFVPGGIAVRGARSRVGLGYFVAVSSALVSATLIIGERVEEDPSGGSRGALLETAISEFGKRPIWGTGPNQYVEVVGQVDRLTAQGWPVHNSVLFAMLELGWPVGLLVFGPVVALLLAGWKIRRINVAASRTVLGFVGGFLVVGMTGWGLLAVPVGPVIFWVIGYATRELRELEVELSGGASVQTGAKSGVNATAESRVNAG